MYRCEAKNRMVAEPLTAEIVMSVQVVMMIMMTMIMRMMIMMMVMMLVKMINFWLLI